MAVRPSKPALPTLAVVQDPRFAQAVQQLTSTFTDLSLTNPNLVFITYATKVRWQDEIEWARNLLQQIAEDAVAAAAAAEAEARVLEAAAAERELGAAPQ